MDTYRQHAGDFLRGQQAPLLDGKRTVIFQCPNCSRVWLMQGETYQLHLDTEAQAIWTTRLAADLQQLPQTLCRGCAVRFIRGEFGIDEYRLGQGEVYGCGYSWEGNLPPAHFLITVHQKRGMLRAAFSQGQQHSQMPTNPALARLILDWLVSPRRATPAPVYQPYSPAEIHRLTQTNPPGAHAPGTERWSWRGAIWEEVCPSHGGEALINFAQAGPPTQRFYLATALAEWRHTVAEVYARTETLFGGER